MIAQITDYPYSPIRRNHIFVSKKQKRKKVIYYAGGGRATQLSHGDRPLLHPWATVSVYGGARIDHSRPRITRSGATEIEIVLDF